LHHLYNGGSNIYLPHKHLEDRAINASKYITLKKQIAINTSKNESSYELIRESHFV